MRHAYRSTYTASYILNNRALTSEGAIEADGFTQAFARQDSGYLATNPFDTVSVGVFEPTYQIQSATINESFSPLIGINFSMKNGIGGQIDLKRSRILMLNAGALQLNETRNTDVTINLSWRREGDGTPMTIFGRDIPIKNTLTLRFETTLRNSKTLNRRLDTDQPIEPTAGTFNFTLKPSVDYMVNSQLTVRAYVEHTRNEPVLSTSFPTRFTAVGVQVRFNLTSVTPSPSVPNETPTGGGRNAGGGAPPGGGGRGQR